MARQVELYDTTLRDGTQQRGINLSVGNKLAIATILDGLGVDFIEGGYAGANPKEDEFFVKAKQLNLKHAVLAAFGNTRRAGVKTSQDRVVQALERAATEVVTLVGKASEYQITKILGVDIEENLDMIAETVAYFKDRRRRVFFDAEHFFDGWKSNAAYSMRVLEAAFEAGAERVILCDTNGGTLPSEIGAITGAVSAQLNAPLGIHAHNDSETAVANSLAAFEAGVLQIQGCANGYGERTGNANLFSVIANLKLKLGVDCVSDAQLASLHSVARQIAEIANLQISRAQPYVGPFAFTHKGGLHAAAVLKEASAYEHIDPGLVGNHNTITISDLAGKGSVAHYVRRLGLQNRLSKHDIGEVVKTVKRREADGFAYENSSASLELLLLRRLPDYQPPYKLLDFKVLIHNTNGTHVSEATIKLATNGTTRLAAGEGNGPVSALNNALKKVLCEFYPTLVDVALVDYKVRVIDENMGTESVVRVLIESSDGRLTWGTVGSSPNVIEASWEALSDSYEWYIYKHSAGK